MKLIRAVVRVERLPTLIQALKEAHASRFYVSRVHAMGAGVDPEEYRVSVEEEEAYTEKAVVEFPCPSERITDLVEVVRQAAQTGRRGDGLILISETVDIVSIRTGDHDRVALL